MADIRIVWSPDLMAGDWLLAPPSLDGSRELATAVAIALFTHRTAEDDDVLPDATAENPSPSRRGWWADYESEIVRGGWPIGSRLWLISREKQIEDTRQRAETYIRESIDPLIDIGLASSYTLTVDWFAFERLGAEIVLERGPDRIAVRFEQLWQNLT